ncbi:MAG TPA: hypothetical protein VHU80_09015 [Polyangiaceae bacterium]|jgi:hypothetical protein|nr:hypothetical protein [Polyangiaceae bacterium]
MRISAEARREARAEAVTGSPRTAPARAGAFGAGLYALVERTLRRPNADLWILALGTLLVLPSIPSGLAADDYVHELSLLGNANPFVGFRRSALDLFRFAFPTVNRTLVNEGVLPWWIDPNVRFAFFRPLASLTHLFDHLFLGDNAVLMHVHTVLWHVLTLVAARALFRAIFGPGFVATLALCLYALDDARGSPVAWVANRNELIACALSLWALTWHHQGRKGRRLMGRLAPLLLGAGMLASEGAIAVTAYLFAYTLILDTGTLRARLGRLVPYAAIVLAWAALYRGLGYGIARSGLYFDPLRDPLAFLRTLPERFAMLWLAELGGPWSEGWNAYPVMFPGLQYVVAAMAVVVIAGSLYLFAPLLRRDKVAQFWLLGAAIATLPACGAFPADRLLPWVGIGGMAVTAQFFASYLGASAEERARLVPRLGAAAIVGAHLVLGPILLPLRSIGISQVRAAIDRADETVPRDPGVRKRIAIYVNPAADPFASYIPVTRAARGVPRPLTQRWLATATTPVHLFRVDERTLRVHPDGGFMILPSEKLFRNTRDEPFMVGEQIDTDGMRVTITQITGDGRPAEVLARLESPLEDPKYLWLAWKGGGYAPFTPPPVGSSVTAPPADLVTVAYGPESPVTKALSGKSLIAPHY